MPTYMHNIVCTPLMGAIVVLRRQSAVHDRVNRIIRYNTQYYYYYFIIVLIPILASCALQYRPQNINAAAVGSLKYAHSRRQCIILLYLYTIYYY